MSPRTQTQTVKAPRAPHVQISRQRSRFLPDRKAYALPSLRLRLGGR